MQELEKILEEIDNLKSECLNGEYEPAYGAGALDMANAIKDIIRSLSRENGSEITRSSRDTEGWVPVEERLPEGNKTVLVCQRGGAIDVAWHDGYRWKTGFSHADWLSNVIAWRPLPEPYKPERSEQ